MIEIELVSEMALQWTMMIGYTFFGGDEIIQLVTEANTSNADDVEDAEEVAAHELRMVKLIC